MFANPTIQELRAALAASCPSASSNETSSAPEVSLRGCIHKVRAMRGFAFVLLRTEREILQCVWDEQQADFPLERIPEGAHVALTGALVSDPRSRAGFEVRLHSARVLSLPAELLPVVIHGKEMNLSLDTLLDTRPISLRNAEQRAIFLIQEGLARGFRDFLTERRFAEIHSPKLVSSGAEGGADVFTLDYFGATATLAQSPQCYKQMMVGVFGRVFEIGPVFRAEKHDTSRHLNEYTSMDLEMGYIEGFEDIMELETEALRRMMRLLREHYAAELELLSVAVPEIGEIPHVRFDDAKALVRGELITPTEADDLSPEEEMRIGERFRRNAGSDFVFITHYPSGKRPFYAMDDPADPMATLSFDLLYNGVEITTGGQRIHDYHAQIAKMERRGMRTEPFASYLMAHKHGLPPHGGLGLGLERLTARLLGLDNLRRAALFPRDTKRLDP